MALYPADSVFVNGYLTTPGQPAAEVWKMITDLGFRIEVDDRHETGPGRKPEPADVYS
jgi:biotin synthase